MRFGIGQYVKAELVETFPKLVYLVPSEGRWQACAYENYFSAAHATFLAASMTCIGDETIAWPYGADLQLICSGDLSDGQLSFELSYRDAVLLGDLKRYDSSGALRTYAIMIAY